MNNNQYNRSNVGEETCPECDGVKCDYCDFTGLVEFDIEERERQNALEMEIDRWELNNSDR